MKQRPPGWWAAFIPVFYIMFMPLILHHSSTIHYAHAQIDTSHVTVKMANGAHGFDISGGYIENTGDADAYTVPLYLELSSFRWKPKNEIRNDTDVLHQGCLKIPLATFKDVKENERRQVPHRFVSEREILSRQNEIHDRPAGRILISGMPEGANIGADVEQTRR